MAYFMIRVLKHNNLSNRLIRFINRAAAAEDYKYVNQIEYLKSAIDNKVSNWAELKQSILSKQGNINQKNIDGVMFKIMLNNKKFDAALSFANHIKESNEVLSLGSVNGLLGLHYELGKENKLSDNDRLFILDIYKSLYEKYEVLDYTTAERLLLVLCVIDEYSKAMKVLEDMSLSSEPSHSAYSTLIATLFKNNKKNDAFDLINRSLNDKRSLQHIAYEEWMNYILRNYKHKKTKQKHLDGICLHISSNFVKIPRETAEAIGKAYTSIGWEFHLTEIMKDSGQCECCKEHLECMKLTEEEFKILQQNIKDKLIVGSDLFLKTSPDELKRFVSFIEKTTPYDIVVDALNVAYAYGKGSNVEKMDFLVNVVEYFLRKDKEILLLGRKHMLKWSNRQMKYLMSRTYSFFTDDLSQDDPYFITAAILSGPHTDLVSKDLLRGHKFLLKDRKLREVFQRWQWQHQWMVYINKYRKHYIQAPLVFTPCAQNNNGVWHLPYDKEESSDIARKNDGTPDLTSWICLKPDVGR